MSEKTIAQLKESEQGKKETSKYSQYVGGTIVILMGIGFLLSANFGFSMNYVWPIVFLVPVGFSAVQMFQDFQAGCDIGLTPIVSAATMLLIAAVWLFDWNWGNIWPVFLIFGGLYAFGNRSKN